MTIITIAG